MACNWTRWHAIDAMRRKRSSKLEVPLQTSPILPSWSQVEHLYAKQFSLRERGLEMVREVLTSRQPQSRRELSTLVKGCCQVLKKAVGDKVYSVCRQQPVFGK